MSQFLIFLRGKGGWGARFEQKVLIFCQFKCKFKCMLLFFFALKDMFRLEKIEKKKEYTAEHIFKPMYVLDILSSVTDTFVMFQ